MMPHTATAILDSSFEIKWINTKFALLTAYAENDLVNKGFDTIFSFYGNHDLVKEWKKKNSPKNYIELKADCHPQEGEEIECVLSLHLMPNVKDAKALPYYIVFVQHFHQKKEFIKYNSSSLHVDKEKNLFNALNKLINKDELFKDPNISIPQISRRLGSNTKYISQVINKFAGKNFNNFINTYRVDAVKSMIIDNRYMHLNLYGIGLICGFKNKTTFYRTFKKMTGQTPLDFKKTYLTFKQ